MNEEKLRAELYAAFKNRALLYYRFFDTLRRELGEEKATSLMKEAIYRRGCEIGKQFTAHAPDDMQGIKTAFLDFIPDGGAMFGPELIRCDENGVDIKFHRCPLKDAWLEAGISDLDITKLCEIAGRIDDGTFESAGFAFTADTWRPGQSGCCFLHIRPGRDG